MRSHSELQALGNESDPPPLPMSRVIWQTIVNDLALSPQQMRIVELILRGKQDKEIATALSLSVPTVRTYLKRIFDRCGVSDRLSLVLLIFSKAQAINTPCSCRCQG